MASKHDELFDNKTAITVAAFRITIFNGGGNQEVLGVNPKFEGNIVCYEELGVFRDDSFYRHPESKSITLYNCSVRFDELSMMAFKEILDPELPTDLLK